jgi:transcriptional regulator with XRE-family HTH domain
MSKRLQLLRKAHGLTQVQLAERAGISSAMVAMIEGGYTPKRSDGLKTVAKIAEALGVSAEDLLGAV